jgi:hypothetical protein
MVVVVGMARLDFTATGRLAAEEAPADIIIIINNHPWRVKSRGRVKLKKTNYRTHVKRFKNLNIMDVYGN